MRSCAENRTGPKQIPTTRAPTRTPSGEKGPEDSWLRVLKASNQSLTKDRPNRFVFVSIPERLVCLFNF